MGAVAERVKSSKNMEGGEGHGLEVHGHLVDPCARGVSEAHPARALRVIVAVTCSLGRLSPPCHPIPALLNTTDDSSRHLSLAVAGTRVVPCQFGLDPPLEALPKGKLDPTHHPQPPGSTRLPYLIASSGLSVN